MTRHMLILLTVVSGCSQTTPVADQQPLVAVFGMYGVLDAPRPTPAECENCGGTKVVGDGTVKIPCPVCCPQGGTQCQTKPTHR